MAKIKTFEHALIVGKFAPLHRGHQLVIETALMESSKVTVLVYSNPDFNNMPQAKRAIWIKEIYPQIEVFSPVSPPLDSADDYIQREFIKNFLSDHSINIDVVFTSEAYGDGLAKHLAVKHKLVDRGRKIIPISGTKIREDLYSKRSYLDPIVYGSLIKKIVLMGAESTGKSTLAAALAKKFNTQFVPEYGREHYEKKNGLLDLEDYVHIANQHRNIENKLAANANKFLFVDTNAITTLFFSYYYNGGALPELHNLANECKEKYDYWFVCDNDIPFEQDGWRDNELLRSKMQRMILCDLNNRNIPHIILSGNIQERLDQASQHLQQTSF